jgi:Domain of unknown function (DUF4399)
MDKKLVAACMLLLGCTICAVAAKDLPRSRAPKDVELYFISPRDGEAVTSPVTVRFGLRGMGIAPGRQRLQLLLADHLHIPHDPPVISKPISIDVR